VVIGFVALLLVLGGVGAFAAYRVGGSGADAPDNATSDYGFTLTAADLAPAGKKPKAEDAEGAVVVQIWDDFFCAECRTFNKTVWPYLRKAVTRGDIQLTFHPFPVRKDSSTNDFAERAANAAVCVADAAGPKAYAAFHDLLLGKQPKSGEPGATDGKLITWARSLGAKDLDDCIRGGKFVPWLEEAVTEGKRNEVTTAPTVRVAGTRIVSPGKDGGEVMPDRKELEFAIDSAATR
jgi:protein-disulfide isomerase